MPDVYRGCVERGSYSDGVKVMTASCFCSALGCVNENVLSSDANSAVCSDAACSMYVS